MTAYIIRRLMLVFPTLIGIMTVNFIIIQIAPGGPVEQMIAKLQGDAVSATERLSGGGEVITGQTSATSESSSKYRGAQGLAPELVGEIERMYPNAAKSTMSGFSPPKNGASPNSLVNSVNKSCHNCLGFRPSFFTRVFAIIPHMIGNPAQA